MNVPTVREVWQLALPPLTRIVAGETSLDNQVTWVASMHVTPPLFGNLEGGELVFLVFEVLTELGYNAQLSSIITTLAQAEISGIVMQGAVTPDAIEIAEQEQLPLFVLPPHVKLREVEQAIVRLIVDYQAQLAQRGKDIYDQLAQIYLDNRGRDEIARTLSRLIAAPIIIQDEMLTVLERAFDTTVDWSEYHMLSDAELPEKIEGTVVHLMEGANYIRCIAPIVIEKCVNGYITAFLPLSVYGENDVLPRVALERGAQVCALLFAKERAVNLAAERWRGQLLDLLLENELDKPLVEHRARLFNYPLNRTQLAVLFASQDTVPVAHSWINQFAQAFVAEVRCRRWQVMLCPRVILETKQEQIVALCALSELAQSAQLNHILNTVQRQTWLPQPPNEWWCAWGQAAPGAAGLRTSLLQAIQALAVGQSLLPDEHYFYFKDLGLYRLLVNLRDNPELLPFLTETLSALEDYDQEHNTELLYTLAVFLEYHGNVSQTAAALNLHRNSLIYRLSRIAELTARDLDSADVRLSLHLALKLRAMTRTHK